MAMFMMDVETHPPSGVDHVLECAFFGMAERCLVVVRRSNLEVYRVGKAV